eukprot:GFUD01112128.1.p1 GENE.GFUD01112128.1~~GFUD01112128.1.p1  ORF type:complete len:162 (+),score=35.94 GFUD01112128.1:79-564(+)
MDTAMFLFILLVSCEIKANPSMVVSPEPMENGNMSGEVVSPNYPENYPNNYYDIVDTILVDEYHTIEMKFAEIDVETCFNGHQYCADWVTLEDGDGTDILERFCGRRNRNKCDESGESLYKNVSYYSNTNKVNVKMHTDESVSRRGFKLEWMAKLKQKIVK